MRRRDVWIVTGLLLCTIFAVMRMVPAHAEDSTDETGYPTPTETVFIETPYPTMTEMTVPENPDDTPNRDPDPLPHRDRDDSRLPDRRPRREHPVAHRYPHARTDDRSTAAH